MTEFKKIKLIQKDFSIDPPAIDNDWRPVLTTETMMPWLSEYFELDCHDPSVEYEKDNTIFLAHSHHPKGWRPEDHWYWKYLNSDYKVVLDNLHESERFLKTYVDNRPIGSAMVLTCENWFWYHEFHLYKDIDYDYKKNRNYQRLALMPSRWDKGFRREAIASLSAFLDDMYWSYISHGRWLPDDPASKDVNLFDYRWFSEMVNHRYFNHRWYDDTCLNIVLENDIERFTSPFITEKTYKPIIFQQPFMILGCPGTLEHLRKLGFKTYDNLWDESYDQEDDWPKRLNMIRENLRKFRSEVWHTWKRDQQMDPETQSRVQHNHDLFFDETVVKNRLVQEIILPMSEYVKNKPRQ